MNKFLVSFCFILILVTSVFGVSSYADSVSEPELIVSDPVSELEQFDSEVSSRLEELPTPTPKPTQSPDEELLKEFKEYRHDSTQLLQYILLFICVGCGLVLCCCAVRFISHV